MSVVGQKRTNRCWPKFTFVRCYSNSGQTLARLECPLSANTRYRDRRATLLCWQQHSHGEAVSETLRREIIGTGGPVPKTAADLHRQFAKLHQLADHAIDQDRPFVGHPSINEKPREIVPGVLFDLRSYRSDRDSRNPTFQGGQTATFQNHRPSTLIQHGPTPYAYQTPCQRCRFWPYQ
jgi:hypothetical protein